ncbi:uncharacterized protein BXIN_1698 [Babesia sp. Xinjiang]|uniref:uncharacterized protein n=1 Tax=Babesia sp. Xinjiang TaxID=462227 RepID=UPI000A234240|nr:uncharacterized protein BXIN_1724 [Babesia sp. Xinjiang]XP_028871422.1 uncharacterized protein BXIN_1698 [Babesia sp. Xinjiang]ORM40865.1 hypothetical protein BXIN_1724 [Babesia sp. Xinjiang]ORM40966.1 hypothetical protein BXIN_1698 [Babesia sp. Xinjiang]
MEGNEGHGANVQREPSPWELEEARNVDWDEKVLQMSNVDILQFTTTTFEWPVMPILRPDFLGRISCFSSCLDSERWMRLFTTIEQAQRTRKCVVFPNVREDLMKLEVLLFTKQEYELRYELARGLVFQIWNNHGPKDAPWYSKLMQLVRDIDACCFIRRLLDSQCAITLTPMVTPYSDVDEVVFAFLQPFFEGETAWSPYIEGELMYRLSARGFITVAVSVEAFRHPKRLLVPKMHSERAYLRPLWIRMTKAGKRAARNLRVTMDTVFHRVIRGIVQQHGENWMYPEMQQEFNIMYYQRHRFKNLKTRLHSVEVWKGGELVAGEIGCKYLFYHDKWTAVATGAVYTSVTGFHNLNSSGTFQLYALAAILHFQGIEVWDLGMEIPYKRSIGATTMSRTRFIDTFNHCKTRERDVCVPERFRDCENGVQLLEELETEQQLREELLEFYAYATLKQQHVIMICAGATLGAIVGIKSRRQRVASGEFSDNLELVAYNTSSVKDFESNWNRLARLAQRSSDYKYTRLYKAVNWDEPLPHYLQLRLWKYDNSLDNYRNSPSYSNLAKKVEGAATVVQTARPVTVIDDSVRRGIPF